MSTDVEYAISLLERKGDKAAIERDNVQLYKLMAKTVRRHSVQKSSSAAYLRLFNEPK